MAKAAEMKEWILDLLKKEGGRPLNKSELSRALELGGSERKELRIALAEMANAGQIEIGKKGRYEVAGSNSKKKPADRRNAGGNRSSKNTPISLVGKIRLTPGGHGWFMPDKTDEANLATGIDLVDPGRYYVSPRAMDTALDGDIVRCKLVENDSRSKEHNDLRARVLEVLDRRSGKVTGLFMQKGKRPSVRTNDERLPSAIQISETKDAKPGQLVAVQITEWEKAKDIPKGKVVEVLGWPGDPGVDVEAIVHQHGINATFPEEVVAAAQAIPKEIPADEIARREDWRKRNVLTIDPKTAKDFDDAILVEKTAKGWQLAVHIADVSHYVKPDSVLDLEARERGNSTYLVDRVIPMLPEELCNGICSLVPQEDRLTKCAVMDFDETGKMIGSYFCDAVICTPRKYAY